jgi:class 3 adenylate cyclase
MNKELTSWLEGLGLGRYADAFAEHHVDFEVLPELTSQDLKELGVALGDRKRLLRAVAALGRRNARSDAASHSVAQPEAQADDADRRQLTVMFCDLVGSTALSVRFDPEDLREIIAAYRRTVKAVVDRYSGYIARYMGDGVLAYFGYPQAHELAPEQAVRAALEIRQAVRQLVVMPDLALQVRIGIATGEVVAGELIGEGESRERAVIGETPNLAARLQAIASHDRVVISDATRRLVGDLFHFIDLGTHSAKGFADPVRAWDVDHELIVESRIEATHRAQKLTPLVGRETELAILVERWEQARAGRGQAVLLVGEAGIGKSRLTQALREVLAPQSHLLLRYFCVPYRNNSALFPVISQLERAARFDRDDAPEAKLDKLEAMLAQSGTDVASAAPLLSDLLSVPAAGRYAPLSLSPQRQKEATLALLEQQLLSLASNTPVLILFEDLHWIDATTIELLDRTVRRISAAPVLLLMTARPEFESPWSDHDGVTTVELLRFGRSTGAQLVSGVTGGKSLPRDVLSLIVDKADGVPLFIEELTKAVLNSHLLREKEERYELAGRLLDVAIPSTLQDSLMARLDRVARAKEVAQVGAAIGRQFPFELLSSVMDTREETLTKALDQLEAMGLVQVQGRPPRALYTFKHALIQDAAYSSMLRVRRKTLHARIAAQLERNLSEMTATAPELLAHHYTRADDRRRAIPYWQQAGAKASGRAAHTEAIKHFTTGLELLRELPEDAERNALELDLQVSVGVSLASTQGYATPAVEATYERAAQLCRVLGAAETFAVTRNICTFYIVRDDLAHAKELAERCVSIAEQERNPSYLVEAYTAIGYVECHRGLLDEGCRLLERCLDVYRSNRTGIVPLTPQDPGVACGALRSIVLWFLGRTREAREQLEEALRWAVELNHPFHLAYVHTYCAMLA